MSCLIFFFFNLIKKVYGLSSEREVGIVEKTDFLCQLFTEKNITKDLYKKTHFSRVWFDLSTNVWPAGAVSVAYLS